MIRVLLVVLISYHTSFDYAALIEKEELFLEIEVFETTASARGSFWLSMTAETFEKK